jgi:NAD(P)-dependent dehydrogenase (short-subunit alcohol dehydrogenase family)
VGQLDGNVAMVFGASSGMGRATALAFARKGAAVAVAARRADELAALAAEIAQAGGRAIDLPVDVSDRAHVDRAVEQTIARLGPIDVVVNAAGVNIPERRMDVLSQSNWQALIDINLTGAFNTTQAPLAHMRERGSGLIIQVSSVSGRWGDRSGAAYQASKHGIIGLCYATMFEEREHGIRVTAILPGLVDTPLVLRRPQPPPREVMDQAMRPEDIAHACIFLATLAPSAYVPELILMPPALQCVGNNAV